MLLLLLATPSMQASWQGQVGPIASGRRKSSLPITASSTMDTDHQIQADFSALEIRLLTPARQQQQQQQLHHLSWLKPCAGSSQDVHDFNAPKQ
jgi:hypothetical protein